LPSIRAASETKQKTLQLPQKFNDIVPEPVLDKAVLEHLKGDYDFDVHIENYFNPFGVAQQ